MKHILPLAVALGLPVSSFAHDFMAGNLEILHPMAFETPITARTGAGYFTINNTGETDDTLIEVRADFPRVMLHKSEEKDGVASMMHVDEISIPAGETVELAPGGYHVMFMGLGGNPFEQGEKIKATLVFEHAGEVEVEFSVEPRASTSEQTVSE